MRLKKFISSALCMTMALTLAGCSFSPKDTISNILNGKGNNNSNANIVASAEKVNKNAVFKETNSFELEGFDYINGLKAANGKYYAAQVIYDYPDYEGEYPDFEETFPDDGEMIVFEGNETETDGEVNETEDADTEDAGTDDADYDGYYDGDYEDYYSNVTMRLHIASFTNANDIQYYDIPIGQNEYLDGTNWDVDSEENFYASVNSYDPMSYNENYSLRKYSLDGTLLKETKIENNEDYFYIRYIFADKNGNVFVVSEQSVYIYDKDLNQKKSFTPDLKNAYVSGASLSSDGVLTFCVNAWEGDNYTGKSYTMDASGEASEAADLNALLSGKDLLSGAGYDFYYKTGSSVMGVNKTDKAATEVVNFYDSDINPDEMYGTLCFASVEQFLSTKEDEGVAKVAVYEKVPEDQVKEKEIITLGTVYGSYYISSQIIEFNKKNDTYRIKLVDYSELSTPDDWDAGRKRFYSDLTGGNAPDIIVPEAYDVSNLIDKGVFTDLTPLMEKGNGIKKSDLVHNAQTVFARDDKLYCVYPTFSVEAIQMKKEFYKEGMTMEDIYAWEKATGKRALSGEMTRDGVMNWFMSLSMDAFLDPKTGKCSFDSPEFVKLLEYSNTYPKEISEDYWTDYDYESYLYELRNNNALINFAYIDDFRNYNWSAKYRFGEDPVLAGLPIEGSNGAILQIDTVLGISSKSKHKEAAWEFVQTLFTHEYYEDRSWGLPSVEKELDAMAKEATEPAYYLDENGNKVYEEESYWLFDHEEKIEPLTTEEAAKLKDFIVNVEGLYTWDEELQNIIDEETQGFFEGQKSASEVSAIIQSRLQIYINEKK